jgi:HK97 family phage major capsid protein
MRKFGIFAMLSLFLSSLTSYVAGDGPATNVPTLEGITNAVRGLLAPLETRMAAQEARAAAPAPVTEPAPVAPVTELAADTEATRQAERDALVRGNIASTPGLYGNARDNGPAPLGRVEGDREMINFIGDTVRSIALARTQQAGMAGAVRIAREQYRNREVASHLEMTLDPAHARAALNTQDFGLGGALIPESFLPRLVDLLYAKAILTALGATQLPLDTGSAVMPKLTAGSKANWTGENRKSKTTRPGFGRVKLTAKDLTALIALTSQLMFDTRGTANTIVVNNLIQQLKLALDFAGLYGDGNDSSPLGLYNISSANGLTKTPATSGAGSMRNDLEAMLGRYYAANPDNQNPGWAMSPVLRTKFMMAVSTTGNKIFPEIADGQLLGIPFQDTTQIPVTSNATDLFLGDWADMYVGDGQNLGVTTSDQASFTDEDGTTVRSAFEENLTLVKALQRNDIAVGRPQVFQILTATPTNSTWSWI